jgi:glycogen operon protein
MTQRDWGRGEARAIGLFLNGDEIPTHSPRGEDVRDDSYLLLFNAHYEGIDFYLPTRRFGLRWELVLSTTEGFCNGDTVIAAREPITVEARSVSLLRRRV